MVYTETRAHSFRVIYRMVESMNDLIWSPVAASGRQKIYCNDDMHWAQINNDVNVHSEMMFFSV